MTIAKLIESEMKKRGITKYALSKTTGIREDHLGKILSGKRPLRADDVWKIGNVLNLNIDFGKVEIIHSELTI